MSPTSKGKKPPAAPARPPGKDWTDGDIRPARIPAEGFWPFAATDGPATQREKLLWRLIDTVPEGILVLDRDGKITFANQAVEKILGADPNQTVGRMYNDPAWNITTPGGRDLADEDYPFARVKHSGMSIKEVEVVREILPGRRVILSVDASPLFDERGSLDGVIMTVSDVTRLRQEQKEVQKSQERFRLTFQTSPDSININRLSDGLYIDINDGFTSTLGFTREDVIGKTSLELNIWVDPNDRKKLTAGLKAFGFVNNLEAKFRRKDGSTVVGLMSARLIDLDEVPCLISITRDISSIKQTEQALERERQQQQIILDHSPMSIWFKDLENNYIRVNKAAAALIGKSTAEIDGKNLGALFSPEEAATFYSNDLKVIQSGQPLIGAIETATTANGKFTLQADKIPWYDDQGKIAGVVAYAQDITEQVRVQKELHESEEKYRSLFSNMNEGVALHEVLYDEQGQPVDYVILDVNPEYENIISLSRRQVVGRRGSEIYGLTQAPFLEIYAGVAATREPARFEAYFEPLHKHFSISVVSPSPGHFATIFSDVTERRQAEEEIHRLNTDLERRVVERTSQLQAANKALESFSYSVSHDLRAPLRAISGFSDIIARRHRASLDEEGQHYLDNIVRASKRMGQLIDDLLTYSRLGRQGVRHVPVSVGDVLEDTSRELQGPLGEAGGRIAIASGMPTILSDRTLLGQIFGNLVENSITFHRPGVPPQVNVSWKAENGTVTFCVSDNGIGIPAEYYDKIFNIFQRLHSDEQYPGTGIGLSNVKKSVDLLGGKIWVESSVGTGSSFFIQLPEGPE